LAWAQGSSAAGQAAAAAQKAGAANAAVPSIQSRVSLVSLDVVVTDASGHAVHALKPGDFSVMEDGQPMVLRSFGEYRADAVNPAPGPAVKLPENVFTNFTDVRSNGPLNVLLLDLLNTPMADQAVVRTQMLDYLKNIPAGTRMAVFGLNTQLTMLQGFTSDPKVLKAAIAAMGTKQSTLLRTAQDDDADNDALAMLNGDGDPTMAEVTQALQNFQAEGAAMQTEIRIEDTLGALDALARYLGGLPGRKNVIWFSGSFPAYMPNFFQGSPTGITKPFGPSVQQDFSGEIRITSDLLARAQAAVYPIDARGIFTNPALQADTSGSSLTNPFVGGMPLAKTDATAVPRAFAGSEAKMEKQTEEERVAQG
jgi:VWFA-related protein